MKIQLENPLNTVHELSSLYRTNRSRVKGKKRYIRLRPTRNILKIPTIQRRPALRRPYNVPLLMFGRKMLLLRLFACFITLTSMSMAAVAAWDRGGAMVDRWLLVALSLAIIAAAHLLPAVSRRPITWLLWVGCVLCAIYGHLVFFTNSSARASNVRVEESRDLAGVERQINATKAALDAISARPASIIAAEMVTTRRKRERDALRVELDEAKRADTLRDKLVALTSNASTAGVTASIDPVTALLTSVTGSSRSWVMLTIGMFFSLLLELVGALVWYEVFCGEPLKKVKAAGVSGTDTGVSDAGVSNVSGVDTLVSDAGVSVKIANLNEVNELVFGNTRAGRDNEPSNLIAHQPSLKIIPDTKNEVGCAAVVEQVASNSGGKISLHEQFEMVEDAIANGKCQLSVRGISKFLNCGHPRARKFRDKIKNSGIRPSVA